MNTKSVKRVSRVAAVLTAPVAAALVISAGPATAAAGDVTFTTAVEYDYTVVDLRDADDYGFYAGVNGSVPIVSNEDATTDTNIYAQYDQEYYSAGYNYNVESGDQTITGEVYPNENTTLGVTTTVPGNGDPAETTVYGDYSTDQFAVGGEYNLTTGDASVYGEIYPNENTTLGVQFSNDGTAKVYGEYDYGDGSIGAEFYNTGEANLYGSHTTEVNDNVSVTTNWNVDLADAPEAADADAS